ncbi:MAG: hypothetical protein RLY93_00800 [Sumerlaeia bacterium]
MARRKKSFPCGHAGYGQFCHQCAEKEKSLAERRERREAWQSSLEADAVDLSKLPKPVVLKAREILGQLEGGVLWGSLGGKKLNHDRSVVSIPITRDYRLLCRLDGEGLRPLKALSHEEYNVAKPGA